MNSLSSMMASFAIILVVIATSTTTNVNALEVGDNICVEGYIMDMFCIDRGTLMDAPTVVTLQDPQLHSFHCLLDVPSCINSEWNVLLNPINTASLYRRGFVLDDSSKDNVISLAKSIGSCDVCDNGTNNQDRQTGFRIVMNATITDLKSDNVNDPPIITVHQMEETADFNSSGTMMSACETYYNMDDITMSDSASALNDIVVTTSKKAGRSKFMKMFLVHGSLMMIGWGLLLPSGVIIARFLKHRPNGLWFKIHKNLQIFGLLIALIGFIIALTQFSVYQDVGTTSYRHGIWGMVVMILGLLQPINAFLRPHVPTEVAADGSTTDNKTTGRIIWEIYHKGSGWLAVILAIPTIVLGTFSLPVADDTLTFQIAYGAGCGGCLLLLIAYIFYDKMTYVKEEENEVAAEVQEEEGAAAIKKEDDGIVVAEQAEPIGVDTEASA